MEKHLHRLLRDVVDTSCLETLKVRLYRLSKQPDLVEVTSAYCHGDELSKALSNLDCSTSRWFWFGRVVSAVIHSSFICMEMLVLQIPSALLMYSVRKKRWEFSFYAMMWIAFLAILSGSYKNWIDVQGMSLVVDQAGLIHCQKQKVPCGQRVTSSSKILSSFLLHAYYLVQGYPAESCPS